MWCEIPLSEDSPSRHPRRMAFGLVAACGDARSPEFISDVLAPLTPVSEIQRRLEFLRSPRTENKELPPRVACGPARGEKRNHPTPPSLVPRLVSSPPSTRGGDGQLGTRESQETGSWDDVISASSTQGGSCDSSISSSASRYSVETPAPDGVRSRRTMSISSVVRDQTDFEITVAANIGPDFSVDSLSLSLLIAPSRASTGPACDQHLPGAAGGWQTGQTSSGSDKAAGASSAAALAKLAAK